MTSYIAQMAAGYWGKYIDEKVAERAATFLIVLVGAGLAIIGFGILTGLLSDIRG